MANSTYLELVNQVCRQVNETELTSATFPDARNIYNSIKDGVKFAINHINSVNYEWPFNYVEDQSQVLTVGEPFYAFPANYKTADWESFYIVKDNTLGIYTTTLKPINKDQFHFYHKEKDFDNSTDGLNKPTMVFPWGNNSFGITPAPNQAYTVKYNYWKNPTQLSAYDNETSIPTQFDYVILLGAMWYINIFRENLEGAKLSEEKFKEALGHMRKVLINKSENVFNTMVNSGYSRKYVNAVKTFS